MKKISLILMMLTILAKILGFFKQMTLAYFYGASNISDAYLISLTIPMTIFAFIGTGLATSYIPIYSSIEKEKGVTVADRFTSNIVNLTSMISTIIVLIVLIFTQPIVKLFASGFGGETLELAVLFTRIGIFSIYFSGMIHVFSAYLQLKKNFIAPALMGLPLNLFIILSIFVSVKVNLIILPLGSAIAVVLQFLFLFIFVFRKKYKHRLLVDVKDQYVTQMLSLALPVILGVSVSQINVLVDRTIASRISAGGISALSYANQLNLFIQALFVTSIGTVFYPTIAKMASENNFDRFKKTIAEAVISISLLVVPTTIGAMVFAEPIIALLFGRGAFDSNAISMTANALFFYSIGMIAFGMKFILYRAFYALQDSKTPMKNAAIALVINICLNIILSRFLGIGGLAFATSISAIVCTILMFVSLKKRIGSFGMKKISVSFTKILATSLLMGIIAKLAYHALLNSLSNNMALVASIGIGVIVYFALIFFMKIEDVDLLVSALKRKIKKR